MFAQMLVIMVRQHEWDEFWQAKSQTPSWKVKELDVVSKSQGRRQLTGRMFQAP
jgi:hypothetical protein